MLWQDNPLWGRRPPSLGGGAEGGGGGGWGGGGGSWQLAESRPKGRSRSHIGGLRLLASAVTRGCLVGEG
jgi:hypothetical protein